MSVTHKIQPFTAHGAQAIFLEGDKSDGCMYFIFDGEVEISETRPRHPTHAFKRTFFGEMALIRAIPRTASAIVTSPQAKLGRIDIQTFAWLAKSNPTFLTNLIGVVAKRAARAMKKLNDRNSAMGPGNV
ncbi:MAG: cyclic nucleotide-binding domain-containing protein [Turneriella sp.]